MFLIKNFSEIDFFFIGAKIEFDALKQRMTQMSKHSNLLSGVESNLNFSPNYVVLRLDLNIIIWIKERFRVFKSH